MKKLKVAACQIDIAFGDIETNTGNILARISAAASEGAELVVFPECALTGYGFRSESEIRPLALDIRGKPLRRVAESCERFRVHCILGFIEKDGADIYNTAAIFCPDGSVHRYRKVHLPVLGVDRFVRGGDLGFPVFDLPVGRIGLNICYDQRFPESARVLMLEGAQLVVVPTNEPDLPVARQVCTLLTAARAYENRVYYMWVNRIGTERGTVFMGASRILDPEGNTLALAGSESEAILYAELALDRADRKHRVVSPGEYEIDLVGHRVPRFYTRLSHSE